MFTWNDNYSVGFDEIDSQHKNFFRLADEVRELIGQGEKEERVLVKIKELYDYAFWHFNTEEVYMSKCDFEFVEEHTNDHKKIIDKLLELKDDVGKFDVDYASELMVILKKWFLNHILVIDKKLFNRMLELNMHDCIICEE